MNKLIIANIIIGKPELQALARERVVAVLELPRQEGKCPGRADIPKGR